MLDEHTLQYAHNKVTDRLTRRRQDQCVKQLASSVFAGVTFSTVNLDPEPKKEKRNPFSTEGILSKPRKKKNTVLHTIPTRKVTLVSQHKKPDKHVNEKKRIKAEQPRARSTLQPPPQVDMYENNWDLNLLDSVSENVAKWIVHEKFEPKDEEDYAQRARLMALVNRKFGVLTQHEHVELIPEDISETDIRDFHQNCLEMGIDLHRLDRVPETVHIPEADKMKLGEFVRNHCKRQSNVLFELKSTVKRKVINRTCFSSLLRKNNPTTPFDLFKTRIDEKYHFITDNDYEQKLINNGKSVKYDRAQDMLTIPTTEEKFKVTWQNVYPTPVNLNNGTHRGMIKWDKRPEQIKNAKINLTQSSLAKKTSDHHIDKDNDIDGPIIYVACRDWQNEWSIAQNWKDANFHQIRYKLKSIQPGEREEAIFSLALAIIEARMEQGIDDETPVVLPDGLNDLVVGMLDDDTIRIRIIAAIIINTLPLSGYKEAIDKLLMESMQSQVEFPDKVLISIMSILYGLSVNHRTCECLLRKYFIEPSGYLLQLMQRLSSTSNLMHAVTAEYLNSCIWEERSAAATVLGQLDQSRLTSVMMKKIIDMAWVDKNEHVRKSAIAAITRAMSNEKVIELCHTRMINDLEHDDTSVRGLDMIIQFNFISEQLFNLIIRCFKNERGMIRAKVCETISALGLFNDKIVKNILQLLQFEVVADIKCRAIEALEQVRPITREIINALAWALRFEDAPICRIHAARAILNMDIYRDEQVIETVRERVIAEDNDEVEVVLAEILDKLGLTAEQVMEQHVLLTRLKAETKNYCQKQNIIDQVVV